MKELYNFERLIYGFLEFFMVGILMHFSLILLNLFTEDIFRMIFFWSALLLYKIVYPALNSGHTLFMQIFRIKMTKHDGGKVDVSEYLKRSLMQFFLFIPPYYILFMLIFRNKVPIYDRFLRIRLHKG